MVLFETEVSRVKTNSYNGGKFRDETIFNTDLLTQAEIADLERRVKELGGKVYRDENFKFFREERLFTPSEQYFGIQLRREGLVEAGVYARGREHFAVIRHYLQDDKLPEGKHIEPIPEVRMFVSYLVRLYGSKQRLRSLL